MNDPHSTAPPPVRLESLGKRFAEVVAVDGLSLHVNAGEVYGLLGPNGAGKTTALRMLVGLLRPTAGRAFIMDSDVAADPEGAKRQVGFLTGSTGLYERLTGREVLTFFGRLFDLDEARLAARLERVTADLDLGAFIDRRCGTLSTGQKQRLSLGRAILPDPPVLVLDEPTNGLDVVSSRFLRDLVRAERDRGKAIVFSTHYLAEAELLCDRVGLVHAGRLVAEGTPVFLRAQTQAANLEEAFLALIGARERPPMGQLP